MGTDIHIAVEVFDGKRWNWTGIKVDSDRNYDLFAILADVRNGVGFGGIKTGHGFAPIAMPRGFPLDMDPRSIETGYDWEDETQWGIRADGDHTPSWLLLSEILDYDYTQKTLKTGVLSEAAYAAYRRGEDSYSYSGDVWGPNVVVLAEDQYAMLGKTSRTQRLPDKEYYIRAYWESTYAERVGDWVERLAQQLASLGDPTGVRLVFNFDS